jgi:hypothetical protein
MIEACALQKTGEDGIQQVEVRAEAEYAVKLYDDPDGQTWIQFREAEEWTPARPVNEFIRDVWVGNT